MWEGQSTVAGHAVTDGPVRAMRPGNAGGAKGTGHPGSIGGQLPGQEEPVVEPRPKQFAISKKVVWAAYQRVKTNEGAAGIDGQSMREFEQDLKNNLYRLWNRLSSGSYMPPPVMAVEIPKHGGGIRVLGVATVADRIAQTVAAMYLEPEVEPLFHDDSFGYRPGRSARQALERCRERCWRKDWVIDLDIRKFFRHHPARPVDAGGAQAHTAQVASPLYRAVARRPAPTGGRNPGDTGSRQPAGLCDLASAGESVHALRVRCLDAKGIPACQLRAVLR